MQKQLLIALLAAAIPLLAAARESGLDPMAGCGLTMELFDPGSAELAKWDQLAQQSYVPFPDSMRRLSDYTKDERLFTLSITPSLLEVYNTPEATEFSGSIYKETMSFGLENMDLTEELLRTRNAGIGQIRIAPPILSDSNGEGVVFFITASNLSTAREGSRYEGSPEFVGWAGKSEDGYELRISGGVGSYGSVLIATVEGQGRRITIQSAHDGSGKDLSWEIDQEKRSALRERTIRRQGSLYDRNRPITEKGSSLPAVFEPVTVPKVPKPPPLPDRNMLPDPSTLPKVKPRPTWLDCP